MSIKTEGILKMLQDAIKSTSKAKTTPYDTTAEVVRVEDGTAWVHIPGGVDETPVKLTINAKAGDQVQVRVSGGRAFLVGNGTAPPTDDTVAVAMNTATNKLVTVVAGIANTAQKIAGNTAQYFWTTETGTDTGAHITEKTQEEFLEDPDNGGANLLLRSIGIAIRYGLAELASFSANGISIGTDNNTRISLDTTNGLKLGQNVQVDTSGNASFSGTITGSSGEFTKGFTVDAPLTGSSTARFKVVASSGNQGVTIYVVDGANQAAFDASKTGVAEVVGTLRANLVALSNGEAVIHAGSRDVAKGTPEGLFRCLNYNNEMKVPATSVETDGTRISTMGTDSTQFAVSGQWGVTGTTYSTRYISAPASDIRLKKNVGDCYLDALKLIKQIKLHQFDWKETGTHQFIGFIADELEQLDPRLAMGGGWKDDKTMSVKSVDTFYLLGYLVKAVQELSAEVESLKKAVNYGNNSQY